MNYEKINFEDLPSQNTPIDSTNLNKLQSNVENSLNELEIEKMNISSKATSEEAESGTDNTKYTTSFSVKKAIEKALEGYTPNGGGDTLPIGAIVAWTSETIPIGWLLCDGRVLEQDDYQDLFREIGTTYGYVTRTDFKLPNMQGRVVVGKNNLIHADDPDTDFNELGKTGGEKEHALVIDEMPSHNHPITLITKANGDTSSSTYGELMRANANNGNVENKNNYSSADNTGGNQPHNNLQPYIVTNYIIKAKKVAAIEGEIIQENGASTEINVYSAKAVDNKFETKIITGQETATNEYIDGKRVYIRRFTFTTGSEINAWNTIATLEAGCDLVDFYGFITINTEQYELRTGGFSNYFQNVNKILCLKYDNAYYNNKSGWVIAKYVKNN